MKKIDFRSIIRYLNPSSVDNLDGLNPYRDWMVMIIFSAIALFALFSAGGYVFWKSLTVMDEKVMLDEQTSVIVINRASVSNAAGMIKAKEDRFKKSLDVIVQDPSL